jgi:hypothetical protein
MPILIHRQRWKRWLGDLLFEERHNHAWQSCGIQQLSHRHPMSMHVRVVGFVNRLWRGHIAGFGSLNEGLSGVNGERTILLWCLIYSLAIPIPQLEEHLQQQNRSSPSNQHYPSKIIVGMTSATCNTSCSKRMSRYMFDLLEMCKIHRTFGQLPQATDRAILFRTVIVVLDSYCMETGLLIWFVLSSVLL